MPAPSNRAPRSEEAEGYFALAIQDAGKLEPLSPRQAAPLAVPASLSWGASMLTLLTLVLWVPLRVAPPSDIQPAAHPIAESEEWLSQDDAEILKRRAEQLKKQVNSEDGKNAAARFNEIVLQVVEGELSKKEAFQLTAELSADLSASADDAEALSEGLKERGSRLEKRRITAELGKALKEGRLADAEEALKRLSERLQQGDEPLSKDELDELRQALEEAREQESQAATNKETSTDSKKAALSKRADELRKKQGSGAATKQEKAELKEAERELKRLDRQKERQKSTAKQTLSELDRQLAKAAKELQNERKKAGEFLDRARSQISKAKKKKLSDKEKKELLKQIEELKERLRRQNKDGKAKERLRKFQQRARGQSGQGKQGAPKPGPSGGQAKPGGGQVKLGPGGQPLPIPGAGEDSQGQGSQAQGREAGHAAGPELLGEESRLKGAASEDKSAVAQDSGQGQSASETIVTAAEEGFSSSSYERLFQEYRTVAEEVMERETVPPGRKAHVRRYFELIRPREQSSDAEKETR